MSFNHFCNNFRGNNFTFQNNSMLPVGIPPLAACRYPQPPVGHGPQPAVSDQEIIKRFEPNLSNEKQKKPKIISISDVKDKLRRIVLSLSEVKNKHKMLMENMKTLSDDEWNTDIEIIYKDKALISESMTHINDAYLGTLRKLLTKRSAKRLRSKRINVERKRDKEEKIKESEERSRKIDEKLQKIKDDINTSKQEEEAKLKADVVLKEVLRKKHDAKKCIVKVDALMKLRKARQNTARGRGERVSERDAEAFNSNIEKLKFLWVQKVLIYEKEESDLRATLQQDTEQSVGSGERAQARREAASLARWREVLFGAGAGPQADFRGDVGGFIAARSQWDRYISADGSPPPVGWVWRR